MVFDLLTWSVERVFILRLIHESERKRRKKSPITLKIRHALIIMLMLIDADSN